MAMENMMIPVIHQEFIGLVLMAPYIFHAKPRVEPAMGRPRIQQAYRPGGDGAVIFGGFHESSTVQTEASGKLKQTGKLKRAMKNYTLSLQMSASFGSKLTKKVTAVVPITSQPTAFFGGFPMYSISIQGEVTQLQDVISWVNPLTIVISPSIQQFVNYASNLELA